MPQPRSLTLFVGNVTSTGLQVVATVPDGVTWLVKSLRLASNGSAAAIFVVVMNRPAIGNATLYNKSVAAGGFDLVQAWDVMEPADRIFIQTGGQAGFFWISGTQLQGTATP